MYCVKCGVQLKEGASRCPLCGTPVWNPEDRTAEQSYPDTMPKHYSESGVPFAIAMTILCAIAAAVILAVCFKLYGQLRWGSYAVWGIFLFYIAAILPCWFRRPKGEIFVPVDHAAAALFLLFLCAKTGGRWFLPFALPVLSISCILSTALICLLKYVRHGKFYIFGGFLIAVGGSSMLIEFFEHLAFGTQMFQWSLFSVAGFGAVGLFLLLAGMIRPLKHALKKRFFF